MLLQFLFVYAAGAARYVSGVMFMTVALYSIPVTMTWRPSRWELLLPCGIKFRLPPLQMIPVFVTAVRLVTV